MVPTNSKYLLVIVPIFQVPNLIRHSWTHIVAHIAIEKCEDPCTFNIIQARRNNSSSLNSVLKKYNLLILNINLEIAHNPSWAIHVWDFNKFYIDCWEPNTTFLSKDHNKLPFTRAKLLNYLNTNKKKYKLIPCN